MGAVLTLEHRDMLAVLSAHSPEMSTEEYAIDEAAFLGLSVEDKQSWALIGAAFNQAVFGEVDTEFSTAPVQREELQVQAPAWPPGMPAGRPIQEATLQSIAQIMVTDNHGEGCPGAGRCIAVVQPPGTGKTWLYRALQCSTAAIVVVVVPLVPLLEEAIGGARAAGLRAFHARDLVDLPYQEMRFRMQAGCLIFVSMEAVSSISTICAVAVELELGVLVVDEAHMAHLDKGYRPALNSFWEVGARFGLQMPTLLLTATLRPSTEIQVIADLGLEAVKSFHVIRAPSDQGRNVAIEWYTSKKEAIDWLKQIKPNIIFVMSRKEAEDLAAELGVLFIHSKLDDAVRKDRIARVLQGACCVATSSIGVGVNLDPKHVVVFGTTFCVELLQQLLGRLRDERGRATVLVSRNKLLTVSQNDPRIAEVCKLLLDEDNFPANLYRLMDEVAPEEEAEPFEPISVPEYRECRQLALKVSCRIDINCQNAVTQFYRYLAPTGRMGPLSPTIGVAAVAALTHAHHLLRARNWTAGASCAAARRTKWFNALTSKAVVRAGGCACCVMIMSCRYVKWSPHNLDVPDGFCFKCGLPCSFCIAGVSLHDDEFSGQRCGLPTRAMNILAEASQLPVDVSCLPIKQRLAWAFAGRRVPNIVRLLATIVPPQ
jgi:hypothetical protein